MITVAQNTPYITESIYSSFHYLIIDEIHFQLRKSFYRTVRT